MLQIPSRTQDSIVVRRSKIFTVNDACKLIDNEYRV